MALPKIGFPKLRMGGLSERLTLWYALYTTILFLVFLVVTFPHEVLIRRGLTMLPPSDVTVDFDGARFAWHRGMELTGVRIKSTKLAQPVLEFSSLWVRPVMGELARGNWQAFAIDAEAYGGHGDGYLSVSPEGVVSGKLELSGLSLGRYTLLRSYLDEGTLAGRIDGHMEFTAAGKDIAKVNGDGEVTLTNGVLEAAKIQGFGVPNLHFDTGKISLTLQGERVELKELNVKGKEVVIEASGKISLREPLDASILDLKALVNPGPEAPDDIKGLLSLLPKQPPGQDQSFRIAGKLTKPLLR